MKWSGKQWLLAGLGGLLGVVILGISFWRQGELVVERQLWPVAGVNQMAVPKKLETSLPFNEAVFQLPNPGILPDHPLYIFKMVKDRVELTLTFNSQQRFSRLLGFADQRMAAGIAELTKGKVNLAFEAMTKAVGYLGEATATVKAMPSTSDRQRDWQRIGQAVDYDDAIITSLQETMTDPMRGSLNQLHETLARMNSEAHEASTK